MKRPSVKQDEYDDIEASNSTRINRHSQQSSVPMLWGKKNNLSELEIMLCASAFAGEWMGQRVKDRRVAWAVMVEGLYKGWVNRPAHRPPQSARPEKVWHSIPQEWASGRRVN